MSGVAKRKKRDYARLLHYWLMLIMLEILSGVTIAIDARGDDVEKLIADFNLCLLNDKTPTFVHSGLGTTSSIDFQWQVADDLHSSDHFPIILNSITPTVEPHLPRHSYNKADLEKFQSCCKKCHKRPLFFKP